MKTVFSRPKFVIPIAAVVAVIIGAILFARVGRAPAYETATAQMATVSSDVSFASTIESATPVDLAFAQGGRIASVAVKEGQSVQAGQTLASLDAGTAGGAVTQAKAALELAKAQSANTGNNLETATAQQNVLVENAYRTLLSSGLQAIPNTIDEAHNPVITGTYTCDRTGSYTITPYASGATSGYSFNYSGIESGLGTVTFNAPQPLGHCGLFITFTPNFSGATTWTVDIPNTKSPSYVTNKNAYDLAVATREKTLADISATLSNGGTSTTQASIDAAEGAYESALGAYRNTLITAPVSGTVSFVNDALKRGQTAQVGTTMISITPKNSYQIETYLSSDDAAHIGIGTVASVTVNLTAQAKKTYHATVVSRALAPTTTGAAESYHIVLALTDADAATPSGTSVTVVILGTTKENVLSIPRSALVTNNASHSVLLVQGRHTHQQSVQIGLIGSDSVEIVSGLSAGDTVALVNKNK